MTERPGANFCQNIISIDDIYDGGRIASLVVGMDRTKAFAKELLRVGAYHQWICQ